MSNDERSLKRFSGEDPDDAGKQLRKWRNWAEAKMYTLKDLSLKQQGAWLYTLLDGKALEAVEHLTLTELQKEDGAETLWKILTARFPEKESEDQMGEALGEVFGLSARDNENMQQWSARVQEVFQKCLRKARVEFPSQAQGWISLNCAGLTEEQKAIVKAKTQGRLEVDVVGAALRSCFPLYKASAAKARKPIQTFVAESDEPGNSPDFPEDKFEDIEAFLADYGYDKDEEAEEEFGEDETAEALAVSWRERRREITKLQQSRGFGAAAKMKQARRSFRVEIEELKKKTRCRRCSRFGHWARECPMPPNKDGGTGAGRASSSSAAADANIVQPADQAVDTHLVQDELDFVGSAELVRAQERELQTESLDAGLVPSAGIESLEAGLISSPGFGIVDSGCGRTLIGRETYQALKKLLPERYLVNLTEYPSRNTFRFGNGTTEVASLAAKIPVGIAKKLGTIDTAIIEGRAPMLLGRPTLEKLRVQLNFGSREMKFLNQDAPVQMHTNEAGQLLIDLLDFPDEQPRASIQQQSDGSKHRLTSSEPANDPDPESPTPTRFASNLESPASASVTSSLTCPVQSHNLLIPPPPEPSEQPRPLKLKKTLKAKECRCLLSQVTQEEQRQSSQIAVAELFCPPRLTLEAQRHHATGLSFDIKQGCDLLDKDTQMEVSELLDQSCPALLLACPPCTHWGGWEHLNQWYRTPQERARIAQQSRRQVKFCIEQVHRQLKRGGHFLFEHPLGSRVWKDPHIAALKRKYGFMRVDMCAYGLKCPDSGLPIRKATGLICSHPDAHKLTKTCPGCKLHKRVEGSYSGGSLSEFTAAYTPSFVSECWRVVGPPPTTAECALGEPIDWEALNLECLAGEGVERAEQADVPSADGPAEAPDQDPELSPEETRKIDLAIKKLHSNLGHPTLRELVRILKHSGASRAALARARHLQCPVCANNQRPASPLPANTHTVGEFNDKVGIDVKYLPSWKEGQKVPAVNILDYATGLQVMVPIFRKETADLTRAAVRDHWISWAGPPVAIALDPSRPNMSDLFNDFCQAQGITVLQTAAESHWQLGKVERHGGWFQSILKRVLDEVKPTSDEEYRTCIVQAQSAKNALLTQAGASPYQLVFGRNPRIPTDLLQDQPHVAASDAEEADPLLRRVSEVRQAARKAVLECQDDRALKAALRARPRPMKEFKSGDWVFYWRSQKYVDGSRIEVGRWYGAAVVLGHIGKNIVLAHKRSIMRCSPEQVRPASAEESVVAQFPENELLGIRNLLEKGQFPKSQFIDLVGQRAPPDPEVEVDGQNPLDPIPLPPGQALNAAQVLERQARSDDLHPRLEHGPVDARPPDASSGQPSASDAPVSLPSSSSTREEPSTYGPVRRVTQKSRPGEALRRPTETQPEDFMEMMQEVVPRLLQRLPSLPTEGAESSAVSPRGTGLKREASGDLTAQHESHRPRTDETVSEALFIQASEYAHLYDSEVEALMAAFMQKRMQKELPPTGNPPEVQHDIDEAKSLEWETVRGKQAMRVWKGAKAKEILRKYPDRFIGSRFVITKKTDEDGTRTKARLCLQGHLDPDFHAKIVSGDCHSPTLSGLGRSLLLQMLVSNHWVMNLGDIKGAFLEAGPLPDKYRPLFARQPEGGIPGLHPDDVLEITGNMYGANNAPQEWYRTFDAAARAAGFQRSAFDNCLYFFRGEDARLCGVLGAHVDDTMCGGQGKAYEQAIQRLRTRFPYRKWRVGNGEFCGVVYSQDMSSYEITFQQKEYAKHLRPISMTRERRRERDSPATSKEIAALRAVNGATNWLCSQTRPDLAVQTSFSQQAFPEPCVSHLLAANQLVQRAKQHAEVSLTVRDVPLEELAIAFHSDAGFANAGQHKTQAGYILAFASSRLGQDQESNWTPFAWKSYKMPRVVASTLAGEAQSYSAASGLAEWMSLMVCEALHGSIDLRESGKWLGKVPIIGITDCKSLYDAVHSPSSPSKVDDKRVAIDLAIIRQSVERTKMQVRWCPTELMLADALTKDQADPADLLRAALHGGRYQLASEATVLAHKKQMREARQSRWKELNGATLNGSIEHL